MKIPIDKFVDWLKLKNLKDRSIKNYVYYMNKFSIYDRFNQESISRFLSSPQNRNTVSRGFIVNYRKFLMVNAKELGIDDNYYKEIATVELPRLTGRKEKKIINPILHNQIPLLVDALETEKLKIMCLLSYNCGLRLEELLKITILSFNWEEWKKDTLKMGEVKVYGKGSKERVAFVPVDLMKRIGVYIRTTKFKSLTERIFKATYKDKLENSARDWQKKLLVAGIKSGLTKLDDTGKPIKDTVVHPHKLRHSFAFHCKNDLNMDIRDIQILLGHSSIQSTEIYAGVDKEKLKEKLSS